MESYTLFGVHEMQFVFRELDAIALALRTVQQERDTERESCHDATQLYVLTKKALESMRADVARLTAWKEEAVEALAQSNVLHDALVNRPQYIGWNVYKAAVHALSHAEQQVLALQEGIEQLVEKWQQEATTYITGSMLPSPVGDMNLASADVVRTMLQDIRAALLAAIKET